MERQKARCVPKTDIGVDSQESTLRQCKYKANFVKVHDPELNAILRAKLEDLGRKYIAPQELGPPPTDPPNDIGGSRSHSLMSAFGRISAVKYHLDSILAYCRVRPKAVSGLFHSLPLCYGNSPYNYGIQV